MTSAVEHYVSAFSAHGASLPGQDIDWLREYRGNAIEKFAALGFPTARNEDWKYTRVNAIEKRAFAFAHSAERAPAAAPRDALEVSIAGLDAFRMVFVDGRFVAALSDLPPASSGVSLRSLADAIRETPEQVRPHLGKLASAENNGFSALNAAFVSEGAFLRVASGVVLEKPILLEFLTRSEQEICSHPRILIAAEANSEVQILERYTAAGEVAPYFCNAITEVALGPGARLHHYKLQEESRDAYHVATLQVSQSRASRFVSHSVSLGGRLVRNDINTTLEAEGAECELNGLYMATGRQHTDYHTRIDHATPRCTSRELYKGVLDGRGRGVFNGRVYVHPNAQKSDAEQVNNNLLLSRDAEIDTKPQLEIYADDVKCSHGATVGQLDENMVFYLRSRGIEESAARGLLTYGFAADVLERMALEPVRARLQEQLLAWLPNAERIREIVA